MIQHRLVAGLALMFIPAAVEAATFDVVKAMDPAMGQLPESMALDRFGNAYVSMANVVSKVTLRGEMSTLAALPVPTTTFTTGVKFGPDGQLYVGSGGLDPNGAVAGVWRISPSTGATAQFAQLDRNGFPNDLAFDDDGTVYVTDSFLGQVWKIDVQGHASVWLSDPLLAGDPALATLGHEFGADGIAFDRNKRNLYITNLDFGTIVRVTLTRDGSPGSLSVFASDPRLQGADGIAFDERGTLYVAVNAQDRLATVDRHGNVSVIAEGGMLDGPSSLAFGVRHCDRHTLFLTNFAISRASGAQTGTPHPGILSLQVQHKGLPLP